MGYERRSLGGWITAVAVVIAVASYILALPVGILAMIISPDLGTHLVSLNGSLAIEAFLLIFPTPFEVNVLPIVVISLLIFGICFVKAGSANGGFRSGLRILLTGSRPRTLPNWLAAMPLVASSLFVIVLLLTLIQSSAGVSTGNLSCPPGMPNCQADLFASIITAPVAEEFGFRISTLGLVVAILVAMRLGRNRAQGSQMTTRQEVGLFFTSFISPGYAKERAGLPSVKTAGIKGISIPEWIFLFITAIIFGAYHIFGGGGWGPGKFLTAALSGFALGLVYLAYGAFADILLHWFFNFYFEVYIVSTPFGGILGLIGNLNALGCVALGLWGIIIGVRWLVKWRQIPVVSPPISPTVAYAPVP
jgi:Type II CAAX prenyl endopeptidase Rce1-like